MKQIERYIFRRMATLALWSLVAATLLVLTTQVLIRINVLTTTSEAFTAFLKIAGALIPSVMVIVIAFALLIGVAQVLWGLNSDSELVVMEAAGAGPSTVFRPVLALSLAMSLLALVVGNFVEPWSNRKLYDTLATASADLFSVAVQSGSFQKLEDGLYIQINEMLPGGEFSGIFLSDMRNEGQELIYFAQRGSIETVDDDQLLVLIDGQVQRRDTNSEQISIVTFTSYALDLSAFLPSSDGSRTLRPREQSTAYLLDPPEDDFFQKQYPNLIKEELIQRLTGWMYPLAFGLISFAFLGRAYSNREEHLFNIGLMAAIALGIRGFGFYSVEAGGKSATMEILSYAVPASAIVIFGALAIMGTGVRMPKGWVRLNSALIDRADAAYRRLTEWRAGRARTGGGA